MREGLYTITPSKCGYTFSPSSRAVNVPPDATERNFTAKLGPYISNIEVTQATQTITNSVPLIAGKPTFVRVYVDSGEWCGSPLYVTGMLRGYGPSGEELPYSPLPPNGGFQQSIIVYHEDWVSQRGELTKTLNFTLRPEWLNQTITLTAQVGEGGNAIRSETLVFQPADSVRVIYVPIRHQGAEPDPVRISQGFWWAYRVYPTAKVNYAPGTTITWDRCVNLTLECVKPLFNELTTQYRLVNAYVFGWLPQGSANGGVADAKLPPWNGAGKAAFGDDDPEHGPRIFAHEIAHLMGRGGINTTDCPSGDVLKDWHYGDAKIQQYGLDGYGFAWLLSSSNAVKQPDATFDYMSYCGMLSQGNVWTSPWTYEHIYSETLKTQTTALATQPLATPQSYFIASGLVYTDDTATLDPIWVITSTVIPDNPPVGNVYCLEARNASGALLVSRCLDLNFVNFETGEAANADGFNLMLPYSSDIARVVLKKGGQELSVRTVSANAPVITVLSPNGGEILSATDTFTITWTASDSDDDLLTYRVLYSPDGSNWVPVGTVITETQLIVNTVELAGGSGAKVRVLATDGINTSADESDAPFTVGRKEPQAYIISPEEDGIITPGTLLWLQGYAYDLEDGTSGEAALRWTSSRDGDLGTGSQVLASLSLGKHIVTLTATDSDGNTGTASINVFVGYRTSLPLILRNR